MEKEIEYAFPRIPTTEPLTNGQKGMTLRDYFAAHCPMTLTEYITALPDDAKRDFTTERLFSGFAQKRMEYADAMIKEREKP